MAKSGTGIDKQMRALIRSYNESGYTQREFCALHGLSMSKFQYWLKKTKRRDLSDGTEGFANVEITAPDQTAGHIIVRYPSGVEIYLPV